MEGNDEEDGEEKAESKDSDIKEEKPEGEDKEKDSPMELEAEDDVDPLDAYMEEVKQEVKKFNIGPMKGNDKVGVCLISMLRSSCGSSLCVCAWSIQLFVLNRKEQ